MAAKPRPPKGDDLTRALIFTPVSNIKAHPSNTVTKDKS